MEVFIPIAVLVIVMVLAFWRSQTGDRMKSTDVSTPTDAVATDMKDRTTPVNGTTAQKNREETTTMEKDKMMMGTRDLLLDTLTRIGCQYELGEEEDKRIMFAFQGEHFMAYANNEWKFVQLWDTHWGHIELDDVEELSRLRKAINAANLNNSVTTVFTINEVEKTMDVHCKSTVLLVPSIPSIEEYLKYELLEFFRAHQFVTNEMMKLREEERVRN